MSVVALWCFFLPFLKYFIIDMYWHFFISSLKSDLCVSSLELCRLLFYPSCKLTCKCCGEVLALDNTIEVEIPSITRWILLIALICSFFHALVFTTCLFEAAPMSDASFTLRARIEKHNRHLLNLTNTSIQRVLNQYSTRAFTGFCSCASYKEPSKKVHKPSAPNGRQTAYIYIWTSTSSKESLQLEIDAPFYSISFFSTRKPCF